MNRALIVIDVQNEYFPGGALPVQYPHNHLENILEVMDAATELGVTTVVVRHHQPAADSPLFRKDSPLWELHPEVEKRGRDLLPDKQLPGSFTNTELEEFLRERKADELHKAILVSQQMFISEVIDKKEFIARSRQ
jgi:nicotinamidase-related amidase